MQRLRTSESLTVPSDSRLTSSVRTACDTTAPTPSWIAALTSWATAADEGDASSFSRMARKAPVRCACGKPAALESSTSDMGGRSSRVGR